MARVADPGLAERRRRQIMDAALACFRKRGFHQSSMHEICAEASLSAGAVYRYFPSKTDIITAIAEDDRRQAGDQFAEIQGGEDLIEALCFFASRFVDLASDSGDAPLVAEVMAESLRDREFAARLRAASAPFEKRLEAIIRTGQAAGEIDATLEASALVRLLLGALDGLCLRASMRGVDGAGVMGDVRVLLERLLKPNFDVHPTAAHARPGRKSARRSAPKETIV
jgi:TetR/AcrR family transcriptional regulator, repressor for uid operon